MPGTIQFAVPYDMNGKVIAKVLATYLMGDRSFTNMIPGTDDVRHGPFIKEEGVRWQLDDTNNYFLRIDGQIATLSCSGTGRQIKTLLAMKTLFLLRYGPNN